MLVSSTVAKIRGASRQFRHSSRRSRQFATLISSHVCGNKLISLLICKLGGAYMAGLG